jgi:hypothetical protein
MAASITTGASGICGSVTTSDGQSVTNALVQLLLQPDKEKDKKVRTLATALTNAKGRFVIPYAPGTYDVSVTAFGQPPTKKGVKISDTMTDFGPIDLGISFPITLLSPEGKGGEQTGLSQAEVGRPVIARVQPPSPNPIGHVRWAPPIDAKSVKSDLEVELLFEHPGPAEVRATIVAATASLSNAPSAVPSGAPAPLAETESNLSFMVFHSPITSVRGTLGITLQRPASECTPDEILWVAIRDRTSAISFERYRRFLNRVLLWEENEKLPEPIGQRLRDLGAHLHGTGAYQVLKLATEVFLLLECGVRIDRDHRNKSETASQITTQSGNDSGELAEKLAQYLGCPPQLPYIRRVVEAAFPQYERSVHSGTRVLVDKINEPCLIELIWSYWHEEGMLMQTMNAISRRFQNVRRQGDRDPLLNVEIDPLRPANNLLWGYVQDEPNRLSVARRASEYMHEYGLSLYGKALHHVHSADTRSKFLEAFHNLLYKASVFYKEDAQTTVIADGYPLLNALKDVHLILAQGAHNQFGDMPWTARTEMLLVQFILARPEIRDFLQSRAMVPYKEPWMPQVDAMKTMQGWTDVTVTHFRDLAVYGEQLLLSVRYGDWTNIDNEDSAKNWARFHKESVYAYTNANRIATGVDLTNADTVDATVPAVLLQRRLTQQHQRVR